ncbi:MAG: hypothetical protein LBK13_04180 [Spirochaetales bacterium]|jgi:hypothetical protein|nr:hypothetical protein [Spirochaetales bacterium]
MSENANRKKRRHFSRNRDKAREEPRVERETPPCCVCGKPIRDILAALLHRETGEPAHFDCIAKQILAGETLAEGERFTYLGSGVFGIIRQGKATDPSSIVIRKKIEYEDKEKAAAWKRGLSVKV